MTIVLTSEYACQVCYYLRCIVRLLLESCDLNKSDIGYSIIEVFDKRF